MIIVYNSTGQKLSDPRTQICHVIDFQALLEAPDDIFSFKFNPSDPNIIAGGCINGQVSEAHLLSHNLQYSNMLSDR